MFSALLLFSLCLISTGLGAALTGTSEGTDCSSLKVQPIVELPSSYLSNLDTTFYQKYVSASGIPIMSSGSVSDYALQECARIVNGVLGNLKPGYLQAMLDARQRVALWASNSTACSIPEVSRPCTYEKFSGGLAWSNILILQETSFNCDKRGNAWIGRVLVHEFNHGVNHVFNKVDPKVQTQLEAAYKNAKTNALWPTGEYAMTSWAEYYAIGAQTWFEANEQRHCDMGVCDRMQLKTKDPQLYDVVAKVYQEPDWLYKCGETCKKAQPATPSCCATVFENANFAGRQTQICGPNPQLPAEFNDQISSIKIANNCTAELYEDSNYHGSVKYLTGQWNNLGGSLNFNDKISSMKVRAA